MAAVKTRRFQVTIWSTEDGTWYWQLDGSNGRMLACPAKGFTSKRNAENALESASRAMTTGEFDVTVVPYSRKDEAIAA